jgi:hypothetical protein
MKFRLSAPLFLPLLLLSFSPLLVAAPRAALNPFDAFVALDHQLTVLDQQLDEAKNILAKAPSKRQRQQRPASRPWAQQAHKMQPTVTEILRASDRLERFYGPREIRLHQLLFKRLDQRARKLRNNVRLLSEARTARWARVVQTRLSRALVAYIVDFQLVSGGYAALRCQAEQLACCEPVRKDADGPFSCRWACSQRTSSCQEGFPGPRIGAGYEQPLSAAR